MPNNRTSKIRLPVGKRCLVGENGKLYNFGIKGKLNMCASVKSCVRYCNNYHEYFECDVV